jgi:phosphoribosylformylglycinamidine synthase
MSRGGAGAPSGSVPSKERNPVMRFGVVVFPGTWSDCDFHYVLSEVLRQPVKYVWHRDRNLGEFDCLILPGALTRNECLQYRCQSTCLLVENADTPFTRGIRVGQVLKMPISHGEGRYYADPQTLSGLRRQNQIVFRYCTEDGRVTSAANPNGSLENIAGIVSQEGNVLGLMPHPERAAETGLGGTDGLLIFHSLLGSLVEDGSFLKR